MKTLMVLGILRKGDTLYLAEKKRGFGVGYINGYGGKVEINETLEEALIREIKEESGVQVSIFFKRGIMNFYMADGAIKEVHIFECTDWVGSPVETDEMKPYTCNNNHLPFGTMWPSDKHWYNFFIKQNYFEGKVVFDEKYAVLNVEFFT